MGASALTPLSGRFLLDTNIVIALLEGQDTVLSNLDRAPEVFIPAVVIGELFFGAAKSGRPSENIANVERFAVGRTIISAAVRHRMVLVTRDRHFREVEDLSTADWADHPR